MLPQITSHLPGSTVHSRLLLASGVISSPSANGDVTVYAHNYSFPPQTFPVRNSTFKTLIHLTPGQNSITLDFRQPNGQSNCSVFDVTYIPLLQNPPLHLVIIVGADSPLRFDEVPGVSNGLDVAIQKFRMAGYLWQAFTGAQMHAAGLGHRTFRLDERWQRDTLSSVDSPRRNTAHVTVLRSKHSVANIRNPENAQQNAQAKGKQSLFGIAAEAIRAHEEFKCSGGEKVHIAALFLDATWDRARSLITGHAALGSQDAGSGIALGIFGSHSLFAWPNCLEQVVSAFNDPKPVDTRYCGVDCEGKSYWMAANVGLGAFLHECGHAFGCPHQPSGVMLRDYVRLNRNFSVIAPVPQQGDCNWHRLDMLRFRRHPCFALDSDQNYPPGTISALPTANGLLVGSSSAPIHLVEFRAGNEQNPYHTMEPQQATPFIISRNQLKPDTKLSIFSVSLLTEVLDVPSAGTLLTPRAQTGQGRPIFGTPILGSAKRSTVIGVPPVIARILVYSGVALDGVEFFPPPGCGAPTLFGRRGGSPHEVVFTHGEMLRGFLVRSGAWIDAVSVCTTRRSSEWFGGKGGGLREVLAPPNCRVVGVCGEIQQWVNGLGVEYADETGGPPPIPPR